MVTIPWLPPACPRLHPDAASPNTSPTMQRNGTGDMNAIKREKLKDLKVCINVMDHSFRRKRGVHLGFNLQPSLVINVSNHNAVPHLLSHSWTSTDLACINFNVHTSNQRVAPILTCPHRVECQCCNAIVALKRHLMMHRSILKVIVSFLWASRKFCEPTRNCFSLRLSRSFTLFFQTMAIFRDLPEIVSGGISLIFDCLNTSIVNEWNKPTD